MKIILVNDNDFRTMGAAFERDISVYNLRSNISISDIQAATYIIYLGGAYNPCLMKCRYAAENVDQQAILNLFVSNKQLLKAHIADGETMNRDLIGYINNE